MTDTKKTCSLAQLSSFSQYSEQQPRTLIRADDMCTIGVASVAKKRLTCLLVTMTILLLTISSLPLTGQLDQVEKEDRQFVESYRRILSMSPDPHLDQAPKVVVNGTSGEFSSSFHSPINDTDPSYIELNWTHVHDTPLEFRADTIISPCADFVYFTQEFDWPYNELPFDAEIRFNYSVVLTGDFETEDYGNWMFNIHAWLIDSSGNWRRIYESNAPYVDFFWEFGAEINILDIVHAWSGMISNSTHPQEDPEDTLTLAIGLSPSLNFENFQSSEPWTFYDGSVYVRVSDLDIYVGMVLPPDPSTHIEPLFNASWGMQIEEVYPLSEGDAQDYTYDIEAGEDGAVYVVGRTSTGYEYYSATRNIFYSEVLLKYDSELNLLWKRKNVNRSRGYEVEVYKGNVYTAGSIRTEKSDTARSNYDSYVTKWGPGGNRIWSAQWGDFLTQEAVGVAVDNDLSVYVLVGDVNWADPRYPDHFQSALLKYNSVGGLMWNKTLERVAYPPMGDIYFTDDRLVLDYGGFFSVRDLEGNEQWNMTYHGAVKVESGNIYITRYGGHVLPIEKWSIDGVSIWNTTYSRQFVNGDYDTVQGVQVDLAKDGSIFVLSQVQFFQGFILTKVNSDGTLNWTKSIGDSDWPYYVVPAMSVSSWGMSYFTLSIEEDFHTYALPIDSYTLPKPGLALPIPIIIGGGVVALVVLVWVYRKRSF